MPSPVPNQHPSRPPALGAPRLAIVGEAPGSEESRLGYPFAGTSGSYLNSVLAYAGIDRAACFVGNVCQYQPPGNQFTAWRWGDDRIQAGIAALLADLAAFAPNLILTLGNVPLHLFKQGNVPPPVFKNGNVDWPNKVSVWRGSLFAAHTTLWGSSSTQERVSDDRNGLQAATVLANSTLASVSTIGDEVTAFNSPPAPPLCQPIPDPPKAACDAQEMPRKRTATLGGSGGLVSSLGGMLPSSEEDGRQPKHDVKPNRQTQLGERPIEAATMAGSTESTMLPASLAFRAPHDPHPLPSPASAPGGPSAPPALDPPLALLAHTAGAEAQAAISQPGNPSSVITGAGEGAAGPSLGVTLYPLWKCLATYHPAFVLRSWKHHIDLCLDMKRARLESQTPTLDLPALAVECGPCE